MPKLTTEEFIKKAREVHGDKYDYSKVEYVNAQTPVVIICPKHGEFLQRPSHHTDGRGCKKCATEITAAKLRYWTETKCYEEASRYSDLKSFRTESTDTYNAALKHDWLKNYTWLSHMSHKKWTKEECFEVASRYKEMYARSAFIFSIHVKIWNFYSFSHSIDKRVIAVASYFAQSR